MTFDFDDAYAVDRFSYAAQTFELIDDDRDLTGKLVDVEVTSTSPWFLMGKAVSAPR